MKKYKKLIIFLSVLIVLFLCRYKINNLFLKLIDYSMDYERGILNSDEEHIDVLWGDFSFQIMQRKTNHKLIYVSGETKVTLLEDVKNYGRDNYNLYIVAKDGCAVINADSVAKICTDKKAGLNTDKIIYVSSYDEFEKSEKKMFRKLR